MGMGLILLILAYVRSENSFDQFQEKGRVRLYWIAYTAPNGMRIAASPPPIAPLMTDRVFPDVELAVRVYNRNGVFLIPEGQEGVLKSPAFSLLTGAGQDVLLFSVDCRFT